MKAIEKRLGALYQSYVDGVEALALEVREKHLIPFCDKHQMRFISGMGSWLFIAKDGTPLDEKVEAVGNAPMGTPAHGFRQIGYLHSGYRTKRYPCKRLLEMLNFEVDRNSDLGEWVKDYTSGQED